jgi:hypothetical protein
MKQGKLEQTDPRASMTSLGGGKSFNDCFLCWEGVFTGREECWRAADILMSLPPFPFEGFLIPLTITVLIDYQLSPRWQPTEPPWRPSQRTIPHEQPWPSLSPSFTRSEECLVGNSMQGSLWLLMRGLMGRTGINSSLENGSSESVNSQNVEWPEC